MTIVLGKIECIALALTYTSIDSLKKTLFDVKLTTSNYLADVKYDKSAPATSQNLSSSVELYDVTTGNWGKQKSRKNHVILVLFSVSVFF